MSPVLRADKRRNRSVVIAAHPDDEVLWFSSVLKKTTQIVICFLEIASAPEISAGRKRCIAGYPLENVKWLELEESGCYGLADWRNPVTGSCGLGIPDEQSAARYRESYGRLLELLDNILPGCQAVYTHNPWGEYGHEDHVQVHMAVKNVCGKLPEEMRPEIWCPVYVSGRSTALMLQYTHIFKNPRVNLPVNAGLASGLKNMYEKYGCWTWFKDWQWPRQDIFVMVPADCHGRREIIEHDQHTLPVQFITLPG